MTDQINIIWLDDDPDREQSAKNMAASLGLQIDFYNLHDQNLDEVLTGLLAKPEPSLIIIDHNLEDANLGVFKKGSTVAAYIRDAWPDCPIICVTGEDLHNLSSQQKTLYEVVIPVFKISDNYELIYSIASSFNEIRNKRPSNLDQLLDLIKAPTIDREKLKSVVPMQLKENFEDKSLIVEISRWIRSTLLTRPGFLFNKLWLSTLLGIKEESFSKINEHFKSALYNGPFAIESEHKWWKSKAIELLYELSELPGLPWEKGRGLEKISTDDYSICYASQENYPETIAYVDESEDAEEVPIKIKHTIVHPDYESLLYFEDIRLMRAAE